MKSKESWPTLAEEALYGLPGDVVRAIDPQTEADRVAVLASLLAASGSACGRGAHVKIGPDAHYLNIFAALVGDTSKGRKGTSWGGPRSLMQSTDGAWAEERIVSGLSSGEGLIYAVRDATYRNKNGEEAVEDEGVMDKRLLKVEPELASLLRVAGRQGEHRLRCDQASLRRREAASTHAPQPPQGYRGTRLPHRAHHDERTA